VCVEDHGNHIMQPNHPTTVSSTINSQEKSRLLPIYYSYSRPLREVQCFPKTPHFSLKRPHPKSAGTTKLLELYTAVLPAVFSVSVFCRYQICWIFGISVGIDPPFLYTSPLSSPLFPKGGGASQKGGHCPPFEEKGGHCPLFDTDMNRPNFPSVSVW